MPGLFPSVKHSPNMQLRERRRAQSRLRPGELAPHWDVGVRAWLARAPRAGPGSARCQEGPAPAYVVGRLGRESGQQSAVMRA